MSDEKVTEKAPDPAGLNCPAAQPLCVCGARGCPSAAEHAQMGRVKTKTRRWRR